MTQTEAEVLTGVLRVRATFGRFETLGLMDAQDALFGLGGFVYVSHVLGQAAEMGLESVKPSYDDEQLELLLDRQAKIAAEGTQVERISYNSPLEIVLAISTAGASITGVAAGMIRVWRMVEDARTERARGRVQREALGIVHEELVALRLQPERLRKGLHTEALLEASALAATQISNLQFETEREA